MGVGLRLGEGVFNTLVFKGGVGWLLAAPLNSLRIRLYFMMNLLPRFHQVIVIIKNCGVYDMHLEAVV